MSTRFKITLLSCAEIDTDKKDIIAWLKKWSREVELKHIRDCNGRLRMWDVETPLKPLLDAPAELFHLSEWAESDGAQGYIAYDEYQKNGGDYRRCPFIRDALGRGMRLR